MGNLAERPFWRAWTVALTSAVLVAAPPLYVLWRGGAQSGFSFVAGDAFLYLTIARHSTLGAFSFDGTTLTNGFHPLWQWLLTLIWQGESPSHALRQTQAVALLSLGCVVVGIVSASLAILQLTKSRLLALATVPGVFYLLVGSLLRCHPAWSDVSGMECGLSVLLGGLLLLLLSLPLAAESVTLEGLVATRGLRSVYCQMGLILPLVILARLDDVFLVPSLAATVLLARTSWKERIRAALWVSGPAATVLTLYLINNKLTVGTLLPVSGMTKAGFVLGQNLFMTLGGACPGIVDLKNALTTKQSDAAALHHNVFRGIQMLYPLFMGALFMVFQRRREPHSARTVLFLALVGYLALKTGYNLVNVNLFHQSTWYYGFSLLLVSFFGAILVAPAYHQVCSRPAARAAVAAFYGVYLTISAASYIISNLHDLSPSEYRYWSDRELIVAHLKNQYPDPKLIAFDDGITAFSLPFSTIHGFVFAGDLATAQARQRSELLHHAYQRGHRLITSAGYMSMQQPLQTSEELRAFLRASFLEELVKAELDAFDYRLAYIHPGTGTPFIEFWPKRP